MSCEKSKINGQIGTKPCLPQNIPKKSNRNRVRVCEDIPAPTRYVPVRGTLSKDTFTTLIDHFTSSYPWGYNSVYSNQLIKLSF